MESKALLSTMQKGTQVYKVLNHMVNKGPITTYQAYDLYGITRLPARISDISALGVNIGRKVVVDRKNGNHWNEYWVED